MPHRLEVCSLVTFINNNNNNNKQLILAVGLVLDMAKLAKIISIFKANDKKNISNYRPISLLPVIYKILEKVTHKNLYTFLEKNTVLYPSQYGFRKNRSTVNAITELNCLSHNKCNRE